MTGPMTPSPRRRPRARHGERRRGLKIKFVRRMGDDFPRAIDLVSSDRVNARALVTHREGAVRQKARSVSSW
jgi:threonine dehydrogenase-like Zn-dependent dehydrogenase